MKTRSRSRSKSRSNRKARSRNKKERSRSKKELPICKPKVYCGGYSEMPKLNDYDKMGSKEECFKKGMGVGMMIELKKIKNKLATKGIILVTKEYEKVKCMDKNGNIRMQ
jgi:hypothetical protein